MSARAPEQPLTLTVEDTAKLLNLGLRQTYEAVRRGDIPAVKIGSRWLVRRAELFSMFGLNPHDRRDETT